MFRCAVDAETGQEGVDGDGEKCLGGRPTSARAKSKSITITPWRFDHNVTAEQCSLRCWYHIERWWQ